jgi:hypothetical protein
MLPARDVTVLLSKLCAHLGLCLDPAAQVRLQKNPPDSIDDFTSAVFREGGLDPVLADRELYRQVRIHVAAVFDQARSRSELDARREWFEDYRRRLDEDSVVADATAGSCYPCPCCSFRTLGERGGFEICPVCFWEDDGQDDHDTDVVRGGPNGRLSLSAARANYARCGASSDEFVDNVRTPRPSEMP